MLLRLLGPLTVRDAPPLSPRERVILAALALRPGDVVAAGQLAGAVWSDAPPSTWPKQVQASISRLRRALAALAIETVGDGYRLTLPPDDLDVHHFMTAVQAARTLCAAGETDRAAAAYSRALALWRGRPFPDLEEWAPASGVVALLDDVHRSAEEEWLDARLASGEHRAVAAEAQDLVRAEPLRERRWEILALAQYRCGRQAEALRTLQLARRTLVDQLGVDPGRGLVDLERGVLAQDEGLAGRTTAMPVSDECPYRGLAPYDVDDVDRYFGRTGQVATCLERLRTTRLLVVTGASGCGKSSLLRAGLAPALIRRGMVVEVHLPDERLPRVTAQGPGAVLLLDQFEEIYASGAAAELAPACGAAIASHVADGGTAVIAIRADHLADLAGDPHIGDLVERGLHFVPPLTPDELRAVVEEPAALAGLRVEPGLVELIVRDTEGEPGALPMLSHALVETWRRRDGSVLTVDGYRESGGIRAAVARSADRLYDGLSVDERGVLRSVMLRLVSASVEGEPIRCRIPSTLLRGDAERERVIDLLVRARLVTAETDTIELAHEALARAWPRLRSWLDDDAAGQRVVRHLATAAADWEALGRPDSELYRGVRLAAAVEHRRRSELVLTALEREYLDASERQAGAERRAAEEQAASDARRARRLRLSLALTSVLLVVALVAGTAAVVAGRDASAQRDNARASADDARLEALVNRSLALRSTDRDVAALLAVEAWRERPDDPRVLGALFGTFTAANGFLTNTYIPDADWLLHGAWVPGTTAVLAVAEAKVTVLLDVDTGEVTGELARAQDGWYIDHVDVSADGRLALQYELREMDECYDPALRLETDGECVQVSVLDVATGAPVLPRVRPPVGAGAGVISPDGRYLATSDGVTGEVAIVRIDDGSLVGTLGTPGAATDWPEPPPYWTAPLAFGPAGELYLGSVDGSIHVVEVQTAATLRTLDAAASTTSQHLVVGADGGLVGSGPAGMVMLDTATGAVRWTAGPLSSYPDPCPWFAASAQAGRVFCGTGFGVVEELSWATGLPTGRTLDPQLGAVGALDVSGDGTTLVSFARQRGIVSRWRIDGGGGATDHVAEGMVIHDGYDTTGSVFLTGVRPPDGLGSDEIVGHALWDPVADRSVDDIDIAGELGMGWVGPSLLAGFSPEFGVIMLYDTAKQTHLEQADAPPVCEQAWSTAARARTYCVMADGTIRGIDPVTGAFLEPTIEPTGAFRSVSATRDGTEIVVTTTYRGVNTTTIHDGRTGEALRSFEGPYFTGVSLDGHLVGALDSRLVLYDFETLEPIVQLAGARGEVNSLQFSEDGAILLATSLDQTVSVYDVVSGTRLGDPVSGDAPFIVNGFLRPDGRAFALSDATGVAVWSLDAAELAHAACRLAGRNLSEIEWRTYFSDRPWDATCSQPGGS